MAHDLVLAFVDRCQAVLGRVAMEGPGPLLRDVRAVLSSAPVTNVPAEQLVIAAVTAFVTNMVGRPAPMATAARADCVLATRAVREILAGHAEPGFGMPDLARRLRVSRWHLSRVLMKVTGHDVRWHIACARVQHSERLLGDLRLSIKEVAAAAGFRSTSAFDRQFHRVRGTRPSDYRALVSRLTDPPEESSSDLAITAS